MAECTLKESAAINQILGRKVRSALTLQAAWAVSPAFIAPCPLWPSLPQWHNLSREEQAKYYELARKERQLHSQLYPTWSARDNYVRAHSDPRSSTGARKGEREIGSVDGGLLRPGRSLCFYRNKEGISVLGSHQGHGFDVLTTDLNWCPFHWPGPSLQLPTSGSSMSRVLTPVVERL